MKLKLGRPPLPKNSKKISTSIALSPDSNCKMDRERGKHSRSAYVEKIILEINECKYE